MKRYDVWDLLHNNLGGGSAGRWAGEQMILIWPQLLKLGDTEEAIITFLILYMF